MANKDKFLKDNSIMDSVQRVVIGSDTVAGSLQPMDANEGKWHHGVSVDSLNRLSAIATDVIETANDAVVNLVRAKMKIGRLMNEAREIIPGDNEFGKWRAEAIADISKTEAAYCMRIEKQFRSAPELIDKMGWSAMREMAYAPESLIKKLKDDPEAAESISKDEARQMVKEEKAALEPQKPVEEQEPREVEIDPGEMPTQGTVQPPAGNNLIQVGVNKYPPLEIAERWAYYLALPVTKRIERAHEFDSDPFIILGLAPDTEIAMVSKDTLKILADGYRATAGVLGFAVVELAIQELEEIFNDKAAAIREANIEARIRAENEL